MKCGISAFDVVQNRNTSRFLYRSIISIVKPVSKAGRNKNCLPDLGATDVLPPPGFLISQTTSSPVPHFLSGFTARLAGTDAEILSRRQLSPRASFGAAFCNRCTRLIAQCWLKNVCAAGARRRIWWHRLERRWQTYSIKIPAYIIGMSSTVRWITHEFHSADIYGDLAQNCGRGHGFSTSRHLSRRTVAGKPRGQLAGCLSTARYYADAPCGCRAGGDFGQEL